MQKEDTKDTKKEIPKTPIQRKIGKTKKVKEEKKIERKKMMKDILDATIKRQYRIKENGFDPNEELEDYYYSEEEQQDGVEINEFGEIIRPNKEENSKSVEDMTSKELMEAIEENDKIIEDNEYTIKQALVERLLEQQKIIDEQQAEIDRLKSQKEL